MKLKNMIQIGSFGFAVALSSTAQSQTYMCQACPAGTYSNGSSTSCTPCPAGKYSYTASSSCSTCHAGTYSAAGSGTCIPCPAGQYNNTDGATSCQKCPAGTYANSTGSTSCTPCPDYHWSSSGASACGRIYLRFWYTGSSPNYALSKWFRADGTLTCNNDTFGGDPQNGTKKYCGDRGFHGLKEGNSVQLNCKTLPCTVWLGHDERWIRFNANQSSTLGGNGFEGNPTLSNGNVSWW